MFYSLKQEACTNMAISNSKKGLSEALSILKPSHSFVVQTVKEMVSNLLTDFPDTYRSTKLLDYYCEKGYLNLWGHPDIEQSLYSQFLLTVNRKNYSPIDHTTVLYWLTQARYRLSEKDYYLYENKIKREKFNTKEIARILDMYGALGKKCELIKALGREMFVMKPTIKEQLLVARACCILKDYEETEFWENLELEPAGIEEWQISRVILLALKLEANHLLKVKTKTSNTLETDLLRMGDQAPAPHSTELGIRSNITLSNLHQEVKHVMKRNLKLEEHYNIENTYIIDFADPVKKVGLDINGPLHFFRPSSGSLYDSSRLNGYTKLKYRLLSQLGWKIGQIRFYEWNNYHDEKEKSIYLRRKLRGV